jgi:hypothetical protein
MARYVHSPAPEKTMRTLLKHTPTGRYFQSLEKWTTKAQEAHDFGVITRALKFVSRAGFRDMELVLTLEEAHSNFEAMSILN